MQSRSTTALGSNVRTIRATLKPVPGFVLKTLTTQATTYAPARPAPGSAALVEVPTGRKVFINICYDQQVPAPAEVSPAEERRAMMGEGSWGIPVVVSDGRTDTDRAGKPALVFDTIFHASLADRLRADADFKTFVQELALERVEDKSGLTLSRDISSPNIPSKGPLPPREALVPAPATRPLIEVLSDNPRVDAATAEAGPQGVGAGGGKENQNQPAWSWTEDPAGRGVKIVLRVPKMTRAQHSGTTLDLEPRRLILAAPAPDAIRLDVPLRALPRDLDVDGAKAEWHVGDGTLVVVAPWM